MKRSPICVHYWLIDPDNEGTCKKCGKTKRFPTMSEVSDKALNGHAESFAKGLKASHSANHKQPSKKLRAQQKREAELRRQATERAGGLCEKCGEPWDFRGPELHHKKPKRIGGTTHQYSIDEVELICGRCHSLRHGIKEVTNGK